MAIDSKTRVKNHYNLMKSQGFKQIKLWVKPEQVLSVRTYAENAGDHGEFVQGLKNNIKDLENDLDAYKKLSTKQSEQIASLSNGGNGSQILQDKVEDLEAQLLNAQQLGVGGDLSDLVHPSKLETVQNYIKQQNEIAAILNK